MFIVLILNISFIGLAYQTYKALEKYQAITQIQDEKYWTKEKKEERKNIDDLLYRILLKWITALLFFNSFWIVEKFMILIPTSLVKLWIGLWILLPNFHGEFFFFNLVSDKLEKFEYQMRVGRNWIVQRIVDYSFKLSQLSYKVSKPYLKTEFVKNLKDFIATIDADISKELLLRKQIVSSNGKVDQMLKDNSTTATAVSSTETLRAMKQTSSKLHSNESFIKQQTNKNVTTKTVNLTQIDDSHDLKTQRTQISKQAPLAKDYYSTNLGQGDTSVKKATKPMKLVKDKQIKDDLHASSFLDESFYSQIEDLNNQLDSSASLNAKQIQSMIHIPPIDKSPDILGTKRAKPLATLSKAGTLSKNVKSSFIEVPSTQESVPSTSRKNKN